MIQKLTNYRIKVLWDNLTSSSEIGEKLSLENIREKLQEENINL